MSRRHTWDLKYCIRRRHVLVTRTDLDTTIQLALGGLYNELARGFIDGRSKKKGRLLFDSFSCHFTLPSPRFHVLS